MVILIVEVCAPLIHDPNEAETVESGSQSTAELVLWFSTDIFVKSSEVKESVILHLTVEPWGTDAVNEVSVDDAATERLADAVAQSPVSIWYSTL